MEQIIISIGRENGSGGRDIALRIADELGLHLYDVDILEQIAEDMNVDLDPGELARYEEKPIHFRSSRRIAGHSNSIEEIVAEKQFEFIRKLAETGKSFVIVGRCADYILKDYKGLLKIFIIADEDKKIKRIAARHDVSEIEAAKIIKKADKNRKHYYERYVDTHKWGEAKGYDLVINSSKLGVDETADVLCNSINYFRKLIEK